MELEKKNHKKILIKFFIFFAIERISIIYLANALKVENLDGLLAIQL